MTNIFVKKHIIIVSLLLVNLVFFGCKKDEPDNPGNSTSISKKDRQRIDNLKSKIWSYRDVSTGVGDNDHAWLDDDLYRYIFYEDDKGMLYTIEKDYDTDLGNSKTKSEKHFKYYLDGEYLRISYIGTTNSEMYRYHEDYLGDYNGAWLQGKTMTDDDKKWVQSILPLKGKCGANVSYTYYKTPEYLEIEGSGDMYDYKSYQSTPWHDCTIRGLSVYEGVTSIGDYSFTGTFLSEVWFLGDQTIKRIGNSAFSKTSITDITLPIKLKEIGVEAFADCKYLKNMTKQYGTKIESIGKAAFLNCTGFKNLYLSIDAAYIGDWAFMNVDLGNVSINEGVKTIGNGVFIGVENKSIELPNSLETIGNLAFQGNYSKIEIGQNIKYIEGGAFCSSASSGSIYIKATTPPTVGKNSLNYVVMSSSGGSADSKWTLYVPKGCKSLYSNTSPWNGFKNIIEDASLGEVSGGGNNDDNDQENDDNSGNSEWTPDDNWVEPDSYKISGKTYKMIKVSSKDGEVEPFRLMQTELPIDEDITINGVLIYRLDRSGDGHVIKSEMRQFLDDLRSKTGIPFRMPTGKEWRFAAMGGDLSKGYRYSGSNDLDQVGWYSSNSSKSKHPIAMLSPNELGFYDMSGNMAEVVNDNLNDIYYIDGAIHGGSWKDSASSCTVTSYTTGIVSGTISGTRLKEKNAFDGRYNTIRLAVTCK